MSDHGAVVVVKYRAEGRHPLATCSGWLETSKVIRILRQLNLPVIKGLEIQSFSSGFQEDGGSRKTSPNETSLWPQELLYRGAIWAARVTLGEEGTGPQSREIPQFIINRHALALPAAWLTGEGHRSHRKITPQWVFDVRRLFVFLNFNEVLSSQEERSTLRSPWPSVAEEWPP